MKKVPKPTNVVQLKTSVDNKEFSDLVSLEFPHVRIRSSKEPQLLNTAGNLSVLLDYLEMKAVFNEMTLDREIFQNGNLCSSLDCARSKIISAMSICSLPKQTLDDHLSALAELNTYHPVKDWLDTAQWDGIRRLKDIVQCMNPANFEVAYIVMSRWLTGCVASLYEPRFSSKLTPVLQGDQSCMKTAFIGRIANVVPRSFLEGAELNPSNKDSVLQAICSWIVELGELERTTKGRNTVQGTIKAFLTNEIDTVRPPFIKDPVKKKRKTHFIATVNGVDFLKDDTGNSRYGVIEISSPIDMERVNELLGWEYNGTGRLIHNHPEKLKQFWLEIKAMYLDGYGWMMDKHEQEKVRRVTERYNDKGSWYHIIVDKFLHDENASNLEGRWLKSTDVCEHLNAETRFSVSIGKALTKLSSEGVIQRRTRSGNSQYFLKVPVKI